MLPRLLPLLLHIQNLTFCLEAILDKSPYETVALVHSNTTVDIVDNIYGQLRKDRKFAWMRFNMDKYTVEGLSLLHDLVKIQTIRNAFFVYFIDILDSLGKIIFLTHTHKLDYRQNHIYVINNYSEYKSPDLFEGLTDYAYNAGFLNLAFLFLNTSGQGYGIEMYVYSGIGKSFVKMSLDGDQCGKEFYDKVFFEKPIALNQYLNVVGWTEPPKLVKTVATVNGKQEYSIGGHDVFIADTVLSHLRASPNYTIFDRLLLYAKRENNTERRVFTVSQIYRYNWTDSKEKEIYATGNSRHPQYSSFDIISEQTNYAQYKEDVTSRSVIYLYPHDTGNYILIVRRRFKSETKYDLIFKSPLILVWAPVAAIVAIVRFIFNKIWRTDKNLADISFETFGLSLGLSFGDIISTAAENFLLWCFCLGTMLSGMLLSSEMFQGFTIRHDYLIISNLGDLETSGLVVYVPIFNEPVESFCENTPYNLNWIHRRSHEITDVIQSGNTENAYAIEENKFNFFFSNDKDTWHVVERFGFHHLSYKLRHYWHLENRMNTLLQRCVEHGIVKYLKKKNKRLLTGIKSGRETTDKQVISPNVQPLSFSDMTNSFLLGALGLLLSAVTFIAELMYFAICYAISYSKRKLKK